MIEQIENHITEDAEVIEDQQSVEQKEPESESSENKPTSTKLIEVPKQDLETNQSAAEKGKKRNKNRFDPTLLS
jgi:hypothetical protein